MNNDIVTLDIETVAKDEKDINSFILEKYDEKWKKLDSSHIDKIEIDKVLEPGLSRIFCICYKLGDDSDVKVIQEDDEKSMLESFWNTFAELFNYKIITFNGINFDIPYIMNKSLIHKIPHYMLPMKKWDFNRHFDTRMYLTNWDNYKFGSLKVWCELMEIEFDKELADSIKVSEWYKAGQKELIIEHCKQDVLLTEQLYLRIKNCLGF